MAYQKINFQNEPSTLTPVSADNLNHMEQGIYDASAGVDALQGLNYAPIPVTLAADMTDHDKIYVYLGSETGYQANHWYYWDGSAWTEGGVYNAQAIATDTTLSHEGEAADAKTTGDRIGVLQSPSAGTNLDSLTTRGLYRLSYTGTYVNSPYADEASTYKWVQVLVQGTNSMQIYFAVKATSPQDAKMYFRAATGSGWSNWQQLASAKDFSDLYAYAHNGIGNTESPASGTDLNTLTSRGFYRLSYSGTYVNSPVVDDANNHKFVEVLTQGNVAFQRYTLYYGSNPKRAEQYMRAYDSSTTTWSAWNKCFSLKDFNELYEYAHRENNMSESFTVSTSSNQGQNKGTKVRVMTYNVANFNNDTSTYITNGKMYNLRKTIDKIDADFALMQEDREYIDSGNTKASKDYLYLPKYPADSGTGGVTVRSKLNMDYMFLLRLSGDRVMRTGVANLGNGISVLLISAHPIRNYENTGVESQETISIRAAEYSEIMQWANGDITLPSYQSGVLVSVPAHTHTIIGMDANCVTADDKANLQSAAAANDMILANGGYLGWFYTEIRNMGSIDVIAVSDNVIINNVEAWSSLYADLYSDHVPVVADLTLLAD